jgi:Rrf2 family cysteine metabolism transcriptional repressor
MIKPSTRARYALRAMIELALHEGSGPILLRQIAEAQRISPKYLEQLTIPLRRAGLLQAERGPQGGYELAKPSYAITAAEIVEAVEGPLDVLECVRSSAACDRSGECAARRLWARVSDAIATVLSDATLADLREEQLAAQTGVAAYQI